MGCNYVIFRDIIIPLLAALIGGGLTLIGVIITIQHGNKKSDMAYIERIKPFVVVEQERMFQHDIFKRISISDDSECDASSNSIILHWNGLLISNVGETVCIVEYIKIDTRIYHCIMKEPLKPGEFGLIIGYPMSCYLVENETLQVSIGIYDRVFNLYEYAVSFDLGNHNNVSEILPNNQHMKIVFKSIDCSSAIKLEHKQ